ncbi:MazG nucleotide pyrophosphohydrolase domain-containing protein [Nesterenkonia ebinurensis]|uniref:MazG nucleotide pyrophosphohydrolase domain-containing protein n=1 Tax=Nesterenkonia ebinurensis TaxID=2608252 RepID=UPI00123D1377|nr:MazG nucleotide pyrophosphohydrolase domain-containing protein [Nesterenkonia ebinurensis]
MTEESSQQPLPNMHRLVTVIAQLREHCPWTAQLTHESLTPYLIEEAQEVAEEIGAGITGEPLRKELGDILLQVVLHAAIAAERDQFDLDGVAEAITAKLIRRNPHVFEPDGTLNPKPATVEEIDAAWNRIKAEEKAELD